MGQLDTAEITRLVKLKQENEEEYDNYMKTYKEVSKDLIKTVYDIQKELKEEMENQGN